MSDPKIVKIAQDFEEQVNTLQEKAENIHSISKKVYLSQPEENGRGLYEKDGEVFIIFECPDCGGIVLEDPQEDGYYCTNASCEQVWFPQDFYREEEEDDE